MTRSLDNRELFDISPLISPRIAVFPGDTPFQETFLMEMKRGHNLTLSSIQTTVHLGAHTDAPSHYSAQGEGIDRRNLSKYLGPAQVITVATRMGQRVLPQDIAGIQIQATRVLFRTLSFPNPERWNGDFMSLSPELIRDLAQKKVLLVGIDTPSVDPAEDKELLSHQAIAQNDMAILEGIVLKDVTDGLYDLIALPLRIEGADASPVRAVLMR